MKRIIAIDSSGNVDRFAGIDTVSVPLKIVQGSQEFVDDETLDCEAMLDDLDASHEKSSTSCPNVADWLSAFGDADEVFAVTISANLSGSFDAAFIAANQYQAAHEGRVVHVFNSFGTGPKMEMICDKIAELVSLNKPFEHIVEMVESYARSIQVLFSLESLSNLSKNGRVSPVVAKAAGLLGIRLIGHASEEGTIEMVDKARGEKKNLSAIVNNMLREGYFGGKVRISHTSNETAAKKLAEMLRVSFPDCDVAFRLNRGLCSYYSERGGLIIGFERAVPEA